MEEIKPPKIIEDMAKAVDGKVDWCVKLPDGSGAATMSFALPKDHWLYKDGYNEPPMPFRRGTDDPTRGEWEQKIREAAKYAVRCATMNGKEDDFDPDVIVGQRVIGMLGYYTVDGFTGSKIGTQS